MSKKTKTLEVPSTHSRAGRGRGARARALRRVVVKRNPAYLLIRDAERARASAFKSRESADIAAEASYSRAALLLYFAALEGFINFVYAWAEADLSKCEPWSTERKWRRAAEECLPNMGEITYGETVVYRKGELIEPFDGDTALVNRFRELRSARNAMIHVRPRFACVDRKNIRRYVRVGVYPLTGLPMDLAAYRAIHAEVASQVFEAMVERLDFCLKGMIRQLLNARAVIEQHDPDQPDW